MFLVSLTSLSPALSTAPPLFPPPHIASPTYLDLRCAVVRSQSWGLQKIILPTGSPTQLRAAKHRERWPQPLKVQNTCLSGRTRRDWPQSHTPGKYHRKGIYFMGYTRQDNQPLFRAAARLPHCKGTATASPLNLLMHCTK